jgi:hypothetical protein
MNDAPREPAPPPASPPISPTPVPPAGDQAPPSVALTPEEQMERFARELKETDWGHQPC